MMQRRLSRLMKTARLVELLALTLLCSSVGCHWCGGYGPVGYASYGPVDEVACDSCGGGCDGACGIGPGAFPATCGTCAPGACGGFSGLMLPLLHGGAGGYGGGCGEVYWGEWLSNPPECCDACNEGGCWAGSEIDGSYSAYQRPGYPYGYGCGLLAGPIAVIRGTYLGVTHVIGGVASTLRCGYHRGVCSYGPPAAYSYGYADDSPYVDGGACSACGAANCGGSCGGADLPATPPLSGRPQGSGVRTTRAERPAAAMRTVAKPINRTIARRMRR